MLNLTFKESGGNLDDIISALIVELEKLARQKSGRQAGDDRAVPSKRSSRRRAEPRLHRRQLHAGREALTASPIEQSIVDAGAGGRRRRRDRRGGRQGKDRRLPRAASSGPGQVETDAGAPVPIESLTGGLVGDLVRACQAAGFEVTGTSGSPATDEGLPGAV